LGIPVAVHPKDAFMLQQGINGEIKPINFEARIVAAIVPNSFEPSEPDILIEKEMDLNDFGVDARVVFTPGHTKGSVSVLCGNNEAIIGDLMMGGWLGGALRGSRPNYHYFIDDINDLHASMKKLLDMKPSMFYVGHGGPLLLQDVIQQFKNKINP
jgi:glyoxylase-like metal-dependent hydrolase (beta-lactamase superfamily II)